MHAQTNIQQAWRYDGKEYLSIDIPCPFSELLPGVQWGHVDEIFTPAFWKYQSKMKRLVCDNNSYQLGRSISEELSVCLLGGYGMPAELGLAAFERLRSESLLDGNAQAATIELSLSTPFTINGKSRKYRFIRQKANYLAAALQSLHSTILPTDIIALRNYLTTLKGIGPKTASWIVRNHFGSNEVAILDVHIIRACISLGIFDAKANPNNNYYDLEEKFLSFCKAIQEPASLIDAIMWDIMRRIGPTRRQLSPQLKLI